MKIPSLLLPISLLIAFQANAYIHPTQTIDHVYMAILEKDSLHDTIMECGVVGYERDRSVSVHLMSDDSQRVEMVRQINRCVCYMVFINDTYPEQVDESARNEEMLKELIASTQFVQLENDLHYLEFRSHDNMTEDAKFAIAYNTQNQCTLDYEPK